MDQRTFLLRLEGPLRKRGHIAFVSSPFGPRAWPADVLPTPAPAPYDRNPISSTGNEVVVLSLPARYIALDGQKLVGKEAFRAAQIDRMKLASAKECRVVDRSTIMRSERPRLPNDAGDGAEKRCKGPGCLTYSHRTVYVSVEGVEICGIGAQASDVGSTPG